VCFCNYMSLAIIPFVQCFFVTIGQGTRRCCKRWRIGALASGLGFRVWGLGFGVWGLGFGVRGLGVVNDCYRVASPKLVMEESPESYKDVTAVVDTCHAAGERICYTFTMMRAKCYTFTMIRAN
jgi:hypothetical protein